MNHSSSKTDIHTRHSKRPKVGCPHPHPYSYVEEGMSMRHSPQICNPLQSRKFCHFFEKQIKCKKCFYSLSSISLDGAEAL
jgi:hypothetical protein